MSIPGLFPGLGEFTNVTFGLGWKTIKDVDLVEDEDFEIATELEVEMETATELDQQMRIATEMVVETKTATSMDENFDTATEMDTETEV